MTTVFVVVADYDHEGSTVVRSFLLAAVAKLFVTACVTHDLQKPECPPIEDSAKNNRLWDRWQKAHDRWVELHPAGSDISGCFYVIQEIELC